MQKKLLIVVVFVAALFAGDRFGAVVLGKFLDNSKVPLAQMYAGRLESDIVLLGNSRAYRHFNSEFLARELGAPVANLSSPGASTLVSSVLLSDFIDIYGPPSVVVFEISGLTLGHERVADLRPLGHHAARMDALLRDTHARLYYVTKISHLFRFNSNFFLNAAHKVFFPLPDLMSQGEMTEPIGPDTLANWEGDYFKLRSENAVALKSIIEITERRGIELRLVISPTFPSFAERNGIEAWRDGISKEIGDIPIWDYGTLPELAPEYFADPVHLNARGVDKFMELLKRDGFF
jgi:hypothetical protein